MDDVKSTAAIIRQARLMQGLTQMEVADLAGINLGQYQRVEYGMRPLSACTMKVGLSICYALHLDPFLLILHKSEW